MKNALTFLQFFFFSIICQEVKNYLAKHIAVILINKVFFSWCHERTSGKTIFSRPADKISTTIRVRIHLLRVHVVDTLL